MLVLYFVIKHFHTNNMGFKLILIKYNILLKRIMLYFAKGVFKYEQKKWY